MTTKTQKERWQEKAKQYRQGIEENTALLITRPTLIKRMAVVRFTLFVDDRHEYKYVRVDDLPQGAHGLEQAIVRWSRGCKYRDLSITRVWIVCSVNVITNNVRYENHNTWDKLIMAQAQRDGRNFHYAKYLMTKDQDRWTLELSGR